jgi:hypothetical protein
LPAGWSFFHTQMLCDALRIPQRPGLPTVFVDDSQENQHRLEYRNNLKIKDIDPIFLPCLDFLFLDTYLFFIQVEEERTASQTCF